MQVTALAEVVGNSRCADGTISLHDVQTQLSNSGLDELAKAVASLARRVANTMPGELFGPEHPWI